MRKYTNIIVRCTLFILGLCLIFFCLQNTLKLKWLTDGGDKMSRGLRGFYHEKEDSVEILMGGTSIMYMGVSPMELYKNYGIKSYNLGSDGQPIEATYYLLEEALKTQHPRVFVVEASSLYSTEHVEVNWRMILDSMPISINKMRLAKQFAKDNNQDSILDVCIPMFRYHDRWEELTEYDFLKDNPLEYYGKGYYLITMQTRGNISAEGVEDEVDDILKHGNQSSYPINIDAANAAWLIKIKQLCTSNNIELLLIKIPVAYSPVHYPRAWSKQRYNATKDFCVENSINFMDLYYDAGIQMDLSNDFRDGGIHCNFSGTKKVSSCLGEYLVNNYNLVEEQDREWDKLLQVYEEVGEIANLELENDFQNYINKLKEFDDDITIFISASDDMSYGLNPDDIIALQKLGISLDMKNAYRKAFVAVIAGKNVIHEELSDDKIIYNNVLQNGQNYLIESSGYYTKANSSIIINGKEYSINRRGLNIVVYDNESGLVIDSVCFDTFLNEHIMTRNGVSTQDLFTQYENYIIKNKE